MKLTREISGEELAELLKKYGYQITRQRGSHIRLTTQLQGEHHITIPAHKYLRIGTLTRLSQLDPASNYFRSIDGLECLEHQGARL